MAESFAVVVAIQSYQEKSIVGVKYAHNDAQEFADVLENVLAVPRSNITIWLDQEATWSRLQLSLTALIKNLEPDDRFYFFYAGHGFWAPVGGNRLTCWDTHALNVHGTTASVEEVLLAPLRQSRCKQSALFIDACSTEIFEDLPSRDLLSAMRKDEFIEFVKNTRYTATFLACSPEEKSYSSDKLKHGVWTYHLVRALRGEDPAAIMNDSYVTGTSLQDYLLAAVRKFTREEFSKKAVQTPFAKIDHNGTFILAALPEPPVVDSDPIIKPDFANAWFVGEETREFRKLDGFTYTKKHTVPTELSPSASAWAARLLAPEVETECQHVALQARKVLKIKSKDIVKKVHVGTGSVDTDIFRFEIEAMQNPDNPAEAVLRREIHLRSTALPTDFDDVFLESVDTLIIPAPGMKGHYVDLLDQIEDREEDLGLSSEGNQTTGVIEIELQTGTRLRLDTKHETLTVKIPQALGCAQIIETLKNESFVSLAGSMPRLPGG
ncbi:caspase family protein [Agrobacterium sp. 22-211-1]